MPPRAAQEKPAVSPCEEARGEKGAKPPEMPACRRDVARAVPCAAETLRDGFGTENASAALFGNGLISAFLYLFFFFLKIGKLVGSPRVFAPG